MKDFLKEHPWKTPQESLDKVLTDFLNLFLINPKFTKKKRLGEALEKRGNISKKL